MGATVVAPITQRQKEGQLLGNCDREAGGVRHEVGLGGELGAS